MKIDISSNYLKAEAIKKGDVITIMDPGKEQESKFTYDNGDPKKEYIFTVEHDGIDKKFRMNRTSIKSMVEVFGKETTNWIGKKADVHVLPTPSGDHKMIILSPIVEESTPPQEGWGE